MNDRNALRLDPATPGSAGGAPDAMTEAALRAAMDAVAGLQNDVNQAAGGSPAASAPTAPPASSAPSSAPAAPVPIPFDLPRFTQSLSPQQARAIELLSDVTLNVKIELGRTRMLVEDVLRLNDGAVVELDKLAGDPVDIYVNDRPVARGEVLVLNDAFCVRVNEILHSVNEAEFRAPSKAA